MITLLNLNFKNKIEAVHFTPAKIDETVTLIQKYTNAIIELYQGLYTQESPSD